MTSTASTVSAEQFRQAFLLDPNPWPESKPERALVQLGLPHATGVTLWLAPERGKRLEPVVTLPGAQQLEPRFVPAGSSGAMRVDIDGLEPDTTYDIVVRTTAAAAPLAVRASTAQVSGRAFSFLASSCFAPFAAPHGVVDSLIEVRLPPIQNGHDQATHLPQRTAHVLRLLEQRARLDAPAKPSFLLGLGDQVYVDAGEHFGQSMLHGGDSNPKSYQPGAVREFFETVYRAAFSLPPYAAALQALPSAMIWDDHEIRDGWGSRGDENCPRRDWRPHLQTARDFFIGWQAARNPPRRESGVATSQHYVGDAQLGPDLTRTRELDFSFDWGPQATFFVMDLRSYRNASDSRVISSEQLGRLRRWFTERADTPTVFVLGSPLPLCQRERLLDRVQARFIESRKDDMLDAWWSPQLSAQHANVLAIIDEHFRNHLSHRLLVISGDVHFSEVLELSDPRGRIFGHEIVSSGLAQTYFKLLRGSAQGRTQLGQGVTSRGIGRFHGPAFAEIFVEPAVDKARPPRVELAFHTSVTRSGKYLANMLGPTRNRLELPLTPMRATLGRGSEMFDRFIEIDPKRTSATAVVSAQSGGALR